MTTATAGMSAEVCMKKLIEFFGKTPSTEFMVQFKRVMSKFTPEIIGEMYQHTTYHDDRLQPLSVLRSYCEHFQERIDDEFHQKQKRMEKIAAEHGTVFGKDNRGKAVATLIRQLMTGAITRGQYVDKLKAIGVDPGLDAWYESMGYDMEDKCRMAKIGGRV